jgi:general secretion pathway protein F
MTVMMIVVVPKVTNIYATLDRSLPWYTALLIFVSNVLASKQMLGFALTLATLVVTRVSLSRPGAIEQSAVAGAVTQAVRPLKVMDAAGVPPKTAWKVFAALLASVLVLTFVFIDGKVAMLIGIGIGLVAGAALAKFVGFLGTQAGVLWKDGMKLRLPLFGSVFRMLAVSRFSRTLATLLKSGVPLLKAMDIVRHVLDNAKLSKVVEDAAGSIREGESIALPLKRSGQFPPIVVHMIAVGEKSGQLEQMLENVARAYDAQVETRVQAMTSLLEPIIIVIMGGGVGFIAFSILMPLIQMNDFVQ